MKKYTYKQSMAWAEKDFTGAREKSHHLGLEQESLQTW